MASEPQRDSSSASLIGESQKRPKGDEGCRARTTTKTAQTIQKGRRGQQKRFQRGPLKNETSFHTARPSSCHREENLWKEKKEEKKSGTSRELPSFRDLNAHPPPCWPPWEIPWICLLKVTDPPLGYISAKERKPEKYLKFLSS
ncbi:hypothetical protein CEXT_467951 [Caerostris extrusa]|uniref:Uncharacterized protein n=1 Tax=Caerostris extrusa TaxID=172846 RepID=A0AAV4VA64_CAEEX|nr:hypothetical protein CEXT_467951 [Caerostris extrusa]